MPAPSEEYRWDDAILKARKDAQGLSEPPSAEFHPSITEKMQPRVSGSMLPLEDGASEGAFSFQHINPEGKRETNRLKVGDLLPHQLSFKTKDYASPLSGDVGEVVAIGPNYADFEFVVPKTERHPTGLLKVRYPISTGRKTGESSEEILQRKREAAIEGQRKAMEAGISQAEVDALTTMGPFWRHQREAEGISHDEIMGRIHYSEFRESMRDFLDLTKAREIKADALGYASEYGPYADQAHIVSEEDVYKASGADFQVSAGYDVVETGNVNGLDVVTFDDGNTYVNVDGSSVNVTGHPAYDPSMEKG
jgi:hypothetical protein